LQKNPAKIRLFWKKYAQCNTKEQQAVKFIQLIFFASSGVPLHDSVRGVERAKWVNFNR